MRAVPWKWFAGRASTEGNWMVGIASKRFARLEAGREIRGERVSHRTFVCPEYRFAKAGKLSRR